MKCGHLRWESNIRNYVVQILRRINFYHAVFIAVRDKENMLLIGYCLKAIYFEVGNSSIYYIEEQLKNYSDK